AHAIVRIAILLVLMHGEGGVFGSFSVLLHHDDRGKGRNIKGRIGRPVAGLKRHVHTSLRFATISRKQPTLVMSWPSGERITVRKMPPGRRSISQSTVFHGAGVNHFLTCSGMVHAAHTSSGATSTTRSRTRSSRGSCWTVAVTSCPPLAAANKCRVDRGGAPTARAVAPSSAPPLSAAAARADRCARGRPCASGPGRTVREGREVA